MRSSHHAAGILAAMFHEFDQARMRISSKTMRIVGQRTRLRTAFMEEIVYDLSELGIELIEIDRGYCLVRSTALNGAKTYTYKKYAKSCDWDLTDEDTVWQIVQEKYDLPEDFDE